jgi:hypothetical protein
MKLETGDEIRITYFAKKHEKTITRKGKWDEKCREWFSKQNKKLITYYDLEAQGYRTCASNYVISVRG